jgi:hypothetical protein
MWQIHRAAHFEWRRAAMALSPGLDPLTLVVAYWREVGKDSGRAWLREIDRDKPVAPQIAALIARVSQVMGEDAVATEASSPGEGGVVHRACPWVDWHRKMKVIPEDRPGCDAWLASAIETINDALGTRVRFETLSSLPEGGATCTRRLWEDPC